LQKPPAGMVICGSGPNLNVELYCSRIITVFPDPDLFDHLPIRVVAFSHPFFRDQATDNTFIMLLSPMPELDNPHVL
jgi:hypothetical protein